MTYDEISKLEPGELLKQGNTNGIDWIILRGPVSVCAYMGLPVNHPFSNKSYEDIDIDVHGGLTFAAKGDGNYLPDDKYWYGWDYAHLGDKCFYDHERGYRSGDTEWTDDMVYKCIPDATLQMANIIRPMLSAPTEAAP